MLLEKRGSFRRVVSRVAAGSGASGPALPVREKGGAKRKGKKREGRPQ